MAKMIATCATPPPEKRSTLPEMLDLLATGADIASGGLQDRYRFLDIVDLTLPVISETAPTTELATARLQAHPRLLPGQRKSRLLAHHPPKHPSSPPPKKINPPRNAQSPRDRHGYCKRRFAGSIPLSRNRRPHIADRQRNSTDRRTRNRPPTSAPSATSQAAQKPTLGTSPAEAPPSHAAEKRSVPSEMLDLLATGADIAGGGLQDRCRFLEIVGHALTVVGEIAL